MEQTWGGGGRPFVLGLLDQLGAGAREVAGASLLSLSVREKTEALEAIAAAARALEAAHLNVVRSLAGEDLSVVGAASVPGLISDRLKVPHGRARADVAAAAATCPQAGTLPGMGAALADGEVSRAHVDVAVATLEKIPVRLRGDCAKVIDDFAVEVSTRYRPKEVAHLAREILDRLDPDRHERGFDPAAFQRRGFTLSGDAYGMGLPSGQLDPLTYAALKAALDHYSAPTPTQTDGNGDALLRDERTPAQRRCDALAEIARRALAAAGDGDEEATRAGEPPRIVIHAAAGQLQHPVGSVDCEQVGPVPATFLSRIVCDCVIERVLLAPNGAVLNLGRAVRTATPTQRRALAGRDRGCVWPGCTIPARWTDAHHVPAWVHGGRTDIDAMCLLCGPHHAQVDLGLYQVVMVDAVPHVIPPAYVDPQRKPIKNTWWEDQQAARALGDQLRFDLGLTDEPHHGGQTSDECDEPPDPPPDHDTG